MEYTRTIHLTYFIYSFFFHVISLAHPLRYKISAERLAPQIQREAEKMGTLPKECTKQKTQSHKHLEIQTTLYELIETVIDVVGTDKNQLVTPVLIDTLRKGKAKFVVSGTISN